MPLDDMAWSQWDAAGDPDHPGHHTALNFWARNAELLPGPLCFAVPHGEMLHGKWQRIISKSAGTCTCGEKRWMLPQVSHNFMRRANRRPVTVGNGVQLALGLQGGWRSEVQVQLEVRDGLFITRALPYSDVPRDDLAAWGLSALHVDSSTDTPIGTLVRADEIPVQLSHYAELLEADDRPIEMIMTYPREERDRPLLYNDILRALKSRHNKRQKEFVNCTLYIVTSVDVAAGTLQILPSANFTVFDRANPRPFHTCPRPAN